MDDQNKNLILATALSFVVILAWFVMFPPEEPPAPPPATETQTAVDNSGLAGLPQTADGGGTVTQTPVPEALSQAERLPIATPSLEGSISLAGGRIDDLKLKNYHEINDPNSPIVRLLSPVGESDPFYALYGWAPGAGLTPDEVPGADTIWSVESGTELTPNSPVTLRWDSPAGLIFRRSLEVDTNYLFTITQSVENTGDQERRAAPYGIIARHGLPDLKNFFILHEGVVASRDGTRVMEKYDNLTDLDFDPSRGARTDTSEPVADGWIGFTDHYWQAFLIPPEGANARQIMLYQDASSIYQTQTVYPTATVAPGQTFSQSSQLFAGAKEWEVIRSYQNEGGINDFLETIDWGWFRFLTKPIFAVLHFLNQQIGNMGWAIIALTLFLKALLFPLAYKSYVSMAKMKELQPEMEKLKERAGDDRQKLQKEMMELYKKEKVNPASGCLPILLQIPIFFSLYKVIFVTLELRHAPFFGPFQDLSAPDPTSLFNLFGLLPWPGPEAGSIMALIFIGILPLLLGISMWLQQKLNPAPTDPTQQMIFAWMPWVFMFMLGGFASGLVIYWISNNVITFTQQYIIMRSQGYSPDVFGNIKSSFKRKKPEAK